MMRTTQFITLPIAAALVALVGCVKSVDQPPLTGPSTFAHSILMTATTDTLTQNGVDFTEITITSINPNGQSENIPLRAQVFVDEVAMDFGTLSTKTPTTPATIRYTAPPSSSLSVQVPTTVTIKVTPTSLGDFRSEFAREIDIRVLPQGVILPTNPRLVADFTFDPADPQAFQTVTFDASTTTLNETPCLQLCTYTWNFGDGTTGTGRIVSKQYRVFGNMPVTLTVTDPRGAQAVRTQNVLVIAPTPPVAVIDVTPSVGQVVGQDIFFSGSRTTSPTGRTIVSYEWSFGDGTTASGVTTSHRYSTQGNYTVTLKVTDDVGAVHSVNSPVTVGAGGPTVTFTVLPAAPRQGQPVTINITAAPVGATTIRNYTINWGDGSPIETVTAPTQSHVYFGTGTVVISVTATDSLGHSRTATQSVTIAP
jgi:PKD repeat protein